MIDSHCHLTDDAFASDLDAVVEWARSAGVAGALCILDVANREDGRRAEGVAERWPEARFAAGVHPHQAAQFADRLDAVDDVVRQALAASPEARAVGEIGLDYHYDFAPRDIQREVFRRQVHVARAVGRPVVIHTREADADTVEILRTDGGGEVQGVFHCFTGDVALARQALDLGFYVSFSGIVTFRRAADIREAAAIVPADRLLAETDLPPPRPGPASRQAERAGLGRVCPRRAGRGARRDAARGRADNDRGVRSAFRTARKSLKAWHVDTCSASMV